MSVGSNAQDSRRLAAAMHRADLTGDEQIRAMNAAARASSWSGLPQWLRDVVAETEREDSGSADA
jgi:hypothetical protein